MVAINQIDIDSRFVQLDHLFIEKERRLEALEADIVEVSGNQQLSGFLGDWVPRLDF